MFAGVFLVILKKSLLGLVLLAALGSAYAATASKTFTVTNSGDGPMTLSNKRISGTAAADYSISGDTCTSAIAAGGTCALTVSFTPTAGTSRPAALEFDSNGTNGAQVIALTGTGQATVALSSKVSAISYTMGSCGQAGNARVAARLVIGTTGAGFTVNKVVGALSGWSLYASVPAATPTGTGVLVGTMPASVSTTGYSWAGSTVDSSYSVAWMYAWCTFDGTPARPASVTFTTASGVTETWAGTWASGTVVWTKQ